MKIRGNYGLMLKGSILSLVITGSWAGYYVIYQHHYSGLILLGYFWVLSFGGLAISYSRAGTYVEFIGTRITYTSGRKTIECSLDDLVEIKNASSGKNNSLLLFLGSSPVHEHIPLLWTDAQPPRDDYKRAIFLIRDWHAFKKRDLAKLFKTIQEVKPSIQIDKKVSDYLSPIVY